MREGVHNCQEAHTLHQLVCVLVEDRELTVTPMIRPFCSTSGWHEGALIVPGVCEGYNKVEAVSED